MSDTGSLAPVTYRATVLQEWVDYNGHLRDAFYLLLFSYASDALMDQIGMDEAGRAASGHSLFTLECHLNFLHEVKLGAAVEVRTRVLGHDAKRLHLYHSLHRAGEATELAGSEQMLLNVELAVPRSAPFVAPVLAQLERLFQEQRDLPRPEFVGRVITLPGKKHV